MKKLISSKKMTQKILTIIILILMFNFIMPNYSQAGIGGVLFDPIANLVTTVGDAILSALQKFLYNGTFDVGGGVANVLLGATYFMANQDKYPEMAYNAGDATPVEINESDFDGVSLYDFAVLLVNPIAGVGNLIYEGLGITKDYIIPTVQYSVDKIFAGQIPAFDINFINPTDYESEDSSADNDLRITAQIQSTIAKWYVALRNLAIVGLLCVLVYVGIRMIISSTASDKAKYRQMLMDWLVAMCLLFVMHYIMAFTLEIIEQINNAIGDAATSIPVIIHTDGATVASAFQGDIEFNTNLMGLVRLQVQYDDFTNKVIYLVLYIALLVYTVKYSWVYMKRTITMMFLTLMAPLVALTYPIDKLNDGKAQAFNAWLKEYIFTALLQPFHLIIYTVLVGSAINIASSNPIYALMVIAFMGPAEKMLRKFFGFDKASAPGMLSQAGAMFGGAAAWNMFKRGTGFLAKRAGGSGGNRDGGNVRTRNNAVESSNAPDGYDALATRNTTNENPTEESENNGEQLLENASTLERPATAQNANVESQNPSTQMPDSTASAEPEPAQPQDRPEPENDNINPSLGQRAWNLYRAPARAGARQLKEWKDSHFGNKERTLRTLKSAAVGTARLAGRAAIAGTVGAIGVGMGIAGDDMEDVLTMGGAGLALGASFAPGIEGRISNSNFAQAVASESRQALHGGNNNEAEVARQTEELYQSGEMRNWAQNNFFDENGNRYSGQDLNELEDRAIGHYNNGFTDKSEIKKVMKLEDKLKKGLNANLPEQEKADRSKAMAETIGKLARDIEPGKLSDKKYKEGKLEEFRAGIRKANPELSDNELNACANQTMDLMMQYYKKP